MKGGYYTVEAAFITTICVWILFALFYSGFYIHDRMLLCSEMNQRLGEHFQDGDAEAAGAWKEEVRESISRQMFLMKIKKLEAGRGLNSADMTVTYELPFSLKGMSGILAGGKSPISLKVSREIVRAADYKWDALFIDESKKEEAK